MFFKINKEKFKEWLSALKSQGEIYIPVRENNIWNLETIDHHLWSTNFFNCRLPPKNLFFPSRQPLWGWKYGEGTVELNSLAQRETPRIIIGLRPCDSRALQILRPVFGGEYADIFYLKNLERTLLISLSCRLACPGSFCRGMGIHPQDCPENDIVLRELAGEYVAKINTPRGQKLLENNKFFEKADEKEWSSAMVEMPPPDSLFDLEEIKKRLISRFGEEEFWRKVADKCLNCGICTYLCPTCHCFDICDLPAADQGMRFRCHDSCAFPNFTKMAVHNPRAEKWRRYRQRVAHKFAFFPQNFQVVACVGCGRCVNFCPVNLDLREVLKAINA